MASARPITEGGTGPDLGNHGNHTNNSTKFAEIQNFVKCHRAFQEVCSHAAPGVKDVLTCWHRRMTRGSSGLKKCKHPRTCGKVKGKPKHKKSCSECNGWADEIENVVFPQKDELFHKLCWKNVTPSEFYNDVLEVAKVFVYNTPEERMKNVTDFIKFDGGSLLMIMKTFSEFLEDTIQRSKKTDRQDDSSSEFTVESSESSLSYKSDEAEDIRKNDHVKVIDKVLEIRNTLCHIDIGSNLQISEADMDTHFNNINRLVFLLESLGHISKESGERSLVSLINQIRSKPTVTTEMIDRTKQGIKQYAPTTEAIQNVEGELTKLSHHLTLVNIQQAKQVTVKNVEKEIHYHFGNDSNGICKLNDLQTQNGRRKHLEGLDAVANLPYNLTKIDILEELTDKDLAKMKVLLERDPDLGFGIEKDRIEEISGPKDLLDCLEEYRLLGPFNLVFLPLLLVLVKREDLKEKVDELAEHMRNHSMLNPLVLCRVNKPPKGNFLTEIKIQGDLQYLYGYKIEEFRERLAKQLLIPPEKVIFQAAAKGCFIIVFQLPENVRENLRLAAIEKAQWLTEAQVIGVHIEGEEYIPLVGKDEVDLFDKDPERQNDDESDILSHVTGGLECDEVVTKESKEEFLTPREQLDQKKDALANVSTVEKTEGQNGNGDHTNQDELIDEETKALLDDINRRIDRLRKHDSGSRFPPVPALKQYIRDLQRDMKNFAEDLKHKSILLLNKGETERARDLLFGALNMYTQAIQWALTHRLNSGLIVKLLLERAECALILAFFTSKSGEDMQEFYDVAKSNAKEVIDKDKDNDPAKIILLLVDLILSSSADPGVKERDLCNLLQDIKSTLPLQIQNHSAIQTVLKVLSGLVPAHEWERCLKPLHPEGSDSGRGSSVPSSTRNSTMTDSDAGSMGEVVSVGKGIGGEVPLSQAVKKRTSKTYKTTTKSNKKRAFLEKQEYHQTSRRRRISTSTAQSISSTDLESEARSEITSDSGSDNLYCEYCDQKFLDGEEQEQHSATIDHKVKLNSIEGNWKFRPPPPNISDGSYEMCDSQQQTTCKFANNSCSKAHSQEELEEWQRRFQLLSKQMKNVVKKNLHSVMDNLLVKYNLTGNKENVMTEKEMQGVKVKCSKDLQQVIIVPGIADNMRQTFEWDFVVQTSQEKSLQSVGLLDNKDRSNFHLVGTDKISNLQIFTMKNINAVETTNDEIKEYNITVSFSTSALGDYGQRIVFDFGESPKLYKKVTVRVGSEEMDEIPHTDRLRDDQIWDVTQFEFVPFDHKTRDYSHPELIPSNGMSQETLNKNNYKEYMHAMLDLEECCRIDHLKRFGITTNIKVVKRISATPLKFCDPMRGGLFGEIDLSSAPLDDSPASQIVLNNVKYVMLKFEGSDVIYEAAIFNNRSLEEVQTPDKLYVEFSTKCVQNMTLEVDETKLVQIQIKLERHLFRIMHEAVNQMENMDFLFPTPNPNPALISPQGVKSRKGLDSWQECAARFIRNRGGHADSAPLLLLYGPFGSGKTHTLATTAMQILTEKKRDRERDTRPPRILLCTHSNSAADIYITNYFHEFIENTAKIKLMRVYATSHDQRTIPEKVRRYRNLDNNGQLKIDSREIRRCQLVITTTSTAARLPKDEFRDFFTHIIIDEAGQALETEAIIPLTLATSRTCVVLAGDYKQMGPRVYSTKAQKANFHHSLLQRLIEYRPSKTRDCHRCILLTSNYRTHRDILTFVSSTFYTKQNTLISAKNQPRHPKYYPLEFRAVMGEDTATGTSFVNECEAQEVCSRVESIIKEWPECWGKLDKKEIGVLTPYTLQVRRIRQMLPKKHHEHVTVERVQNVQGKQYRVVLVSTVRTHQSAPSKHYEGVSKLHSSDYLAFLSDLRYLNTAFTRAKSLLIVVGNPKTLCFVGRCCIVWTYYLNKCRQHGSLYPKDLSEEEIKVQSQSLSSLEVTDASSHTEVPRNKLFGRQSSGTWAAEIFQNKLQAPTENKYISDDFELKDLDEIENDFISKWLDRQLKHDIAKLPSKTADDDDDDDDDDDGDDDGGAFQGGPYVKRRQASRRRLECKFCVDYDRQLYAVSLDHPQGSKKIRIGTNTQRNTALDGDLVDVEIIPDTDRGKDEEVFGQVVEIKKRAVKMEGRKVVCFLDLFSDDLMVPIEPTLPKIKMLILPNEKQKAKNRGPLSIPVYKFQTQETGQDIHQNPSPFVLQETVEVTNKDRPNKLFLVHWLKWDENYYYPLGIIIRKLPQGNNVHDAQRILKVAYSVPTNLDKNPYPREWTIPSHEIERRRKCDFRTKAIFTIDPDDAQDFDDALSIEGNPTVGFTVGIHIADVSYFLDENSDIDNIAKERATTFYPHDSEPIYMLPQTLSTSHCSLLAGEDRLAVSLFVKLDKNGQVVDDGRPVSERVKRSIVRCCHNLRYKDVQQGILGEKKIVDVHEKVLQLQRLASHHRQKRLGMKKYTEHGDHQVEKYPQARALVEELMIIANCQVAVDLFAKYPTCTPLHRQLQPQREQFLEWWKTNQNIIKYSLFLESQKERLFYGTTERYTQCNMTVKHHETVTLLQNVWEELKELAKTGNMEELSTLICSDSKHPKHAFVLRALQQIMQKSEDVNSGDYEKTKISELAHAELRVAMSTHFTAPVRRYLDIVVQRLLLSAASDQKSPPYSATEITDICHYCSVRSSNAREFEKKTRALHLASEIEKSPLKILSIIENLSEESMMLGFSPYRSVLSAHQRNEIRFNSLKPSKQPLYVKENGSISISWTEQISHLHSGDLSRYDIERNQVKREKVLNDKRFIVKLPGLKWMEILKQINSNSTDGLQDTISKTDAELKIKDKSRQAYGKRSIQSANESPIVDEVTCNTDRYVNFKRCFRLGDVVQVQLGAGLKRGIFSPKIDIVNITPMLEFCLEHRVNPVESFAEIVDESPRRDNIKRYQNTWIPILEMEAAHTAIQANDSTIIHGVHIKWLHKYEDLHPCGSFSLPGSFCKRRQIRLFSDKGSRLKQWFLCIRYQINEDSGRISFGGLRSEHSSSIVTTENHTFVAHAFIVDVTEPDSPSEGATDSLEDQAYTVFFEVRQCLSPFPPVLLYTPLDETPSCTIELIQKTLPDRRTEEAVDKLQSAPHLIQSICLMQPVTDMLQEGEIDRRLTAIAGQIQLEHDIEGSPFPSLNDPQKAVIKSSFQQPFTVVHGPPGTGKTVTGAHMVYFFTQMNSQLKSRENEHGEHQKKGRPQVLYSGPSNKSVDVITGKLREFKDNLDSGRIRHNLSFVRVYSDAIESRYYPIYGFPKSTGKHTIQHDIKPDIEQDTLHYKIRQRRDSADIISFEKKFGVKSRREPTVEQYETYKMAIRLAKIAEIKRNNIILCTCSTAGSTLIKKNTNIIECIVDEAGMCSEPETLIPLVATKPKRIVLIGDHKQLRPIIKEQIAKQLGLDISLLEKYSDDMVMLKIQYRMHKAICDFPSRVFYKKKLQTGRSSTCEKYKKLIWQWPGHQPTVFCHIIGQEESISVTTEEGSERSKSNRPEMLEVVRIVKALVKEHGVNQEKVAVLTQYRQQYNKIVEALSKEFPGVTVSTVIMSQGSEWDFVILSTVRTLPWYQIEERPTRGWSNANLGFITDENQMNVALTRAREGLAIVGNMHLLRTDKRWRKLLSCYEKNKCILRAQQFLSWK